MADPVFNLVAYASVGFVYKELRFRVCALHVIYCKSPRVNETCPFYPIWILLLFFFLPWLAFWQFSLFSSAVQCAQGRQRVEHFPKPRVLLCAENPQLKGHFLPGTVSTIGEGTVSTIGGGRLCTQLAGNLHEIPAPMRHRLWKAPPPSRMKGSMQDSMWRCAPDELVWLLHTLFAVLWRRRMMLWIQPAGDKNGVMMFIWHLVNSCYNRNQTKPKMLACADLDQNNALTHPKSVFHFVWVTGVEQKNK